MTTWMFCLFSIAGKEIINEEGTLTSYGIGVIGFVCFCLIALAAMYIPNILNKKKGVDSAEKKRIAEIVGKIVPAGESCTAAYAGWMTTEQLAKEGKKNQLQGIFLRGKESAWFSKRQEER